jgi:hypothetical protein
VAMGQAPLTDRSGRRAAIVTLRPDQLINDQLNAN